MPSFTPLSPAEEDIIVHHGTEPPRSGEYDSFFKAGAYICKRCRSPLYSSKSKFDAGCGWPSFDDEYPDAVRRLIDSDGRRTEIRCTACDAHLGHVFEGEKMTDKNTRHCVNSLSLQFIPEKEPLSSPALHRAYFGGGCFWCTEAVFSMVNGVTSVTPGYAGGSSEKPNYMIVSSGKTGHAEVIRITFDPAIVTYRNLLNVFFACHDPTTLNQQGNDIGTQYRSLILTVNDEQKKDASKAINEMQKNEKRKIVTEIADLKTFHEAESEHRQYYERHPEEAYCSIVISPKLQHLRKTHPSLLSAVTE
ncbi:MAG: bifunctional methionine sulfoxide reductase B/A protein [Candidatus Peribacteraceae bacterium]|nr:bifunctional methionine sulfoxide reductase B/A protein [Candidatus Peribacteraceae bacterium]